MARRAGFREALTARLHDYAMRGRECLLSRFVGIVALAALTGCGFVLVDGENPSLCAQPDFVLRLQNGVDRIEVWEGNRHGFAREPRDVFTETAAVQALLGFVLERDDAWFIAAGETYDPATRRSGAAHTLKFMRGTQEVAYVATNQTYLETPGCGYEVSRVLNVADQQAWHALVFGRASPR